MNAIIGREDFYARHNVSVRDIRNMGAVLGLKPCRHFLFLAQLCVIVKMKY